MQYGLLGKTLKHSYSPQLHALMGDPGYRLYEMPEHEVADFLRQGAFDGINVTIPYKETVLPLLDAVSPEASAIGSVNTVIRKNGKLWGDNTDHYGFSALLRRAGIAVKDRKCLILGSGGSARTVRAVLSAAGAAAIVTISRSGKDNYQNIARHYDAQVIVNTTPVGMYPNNNAAPLSLEGFTLLEAVVDIIYNPARTALLQDAEARGLKCSDGLPMLVYQAKRARELFDGSVISDQVAEEILARLRRQMRSITLIGMPGCGKTTVGQFLALQLQRQLTDTDQLFIDTYGKTAEEVITTQGESAFRDAESTVVAQACSQSGLVIATGGGAVLRSDNRTLIRSNSYVVYLQRDVDSLCTDGRPLSAGGIDALKALCEKRDPIYQSVCDLAVDNNGHPAQTAKKILEALGYEDSCH